MEDPSKADIAEQASQVFKQNPKPDHRRNHVMKSSPLDLSQASAKANAKVSADTQGKGVISSGTEKKIVGLSSAKGVVKTGPSIAVAVVSPEGSSLKPSGDSETAGQEHRVGDQESVLSALNKVPGSQAGRSALSPLPQEIHSSGPDDDHKLQMIAEAKQLEEEIATLDLKSVQALAYVFIAKHGNLDKAFTWFDTNRRQQISNNQWDTGLSLLHIDVPKLTGFNANHLFGMMNKGSGTVTRSLWREFFADVDEGTLRMKARTSGFEGSIAERAKLRQGLRCPSSNRPHAGSGSAKDKGSVSHNDKRDGSHRGAEILADMPHGYNASGGSSDNHKDDYSHTKSSEVHEVSDKAVHDRKNISDFDCDSMNETSKRDGNVVNVAGGGTTESDQSYPLSEIEVFDFRQRVMAELSGLEEGEFKEYAATLGAQKIGIVDEVAEELGLWSHSLGEQPSVERSLSRGGLDIHGGILVGRVHEFAQDVEAKLSAIEEGCSFDFEPGLPAPLRRVVHLIAQYLELQTQSQGIGKTRFITASNLGEFGAMIRRQLLAIPAGESNAFPKTFSIAQRKLVHLVAAELGLWSFSQGGGDERYIEVFNLKDFSAETRLKLSSLSPGEHYDFGSDLNEKQRKVVHLIAHELGMMSLSQGNDEQRHVSVANLRDFRAWVRDQLEHLGPNESKEFPRELSRLQRKVVQGLADELSMRSLLRGRTSDLTEARVIVVTREGISGSQDELEDNLSESDEEQEESEEEEEDHDDELSMISKLFDAYATGTYRGKKIMLRFPDLGQFAEDLSDVMPDKVKNFKKFMSLLENVFDDTLQLQQDFGTRTSKGLTLQWFQVFIQKAARRVGWSIVGILFAMADLCA
jgi:hypothetical protein